MRPRLQRKILCRILLVLCVFIVIFLPNVFKLNPTLNRFDQIRPLKVIVIGSDDGSRKSESTRTKQNDNVEECHIPQLDINGSEVVHFFKDTPFHCGNAAKNISDLDGKGRFRILKEGATCKVRSIIRGKDDDEHSLGEWKSISNGDALPFESVDVECMSDQKTWSTFLIAPQLSNEIVDAAKKRQEKSGLGLNVLMMSFDSMSQMTFRRKLPKSVEVLEKTLGAVVLNGYNIVGDGTPQAFIPILTGKTEEELPLTRKRFKDAQPLDKVYPMVWNNFSESGYITLFAEDDASYGMFNYRLKGFSRQPTDLYMRPAVQAMEKRYKRTFVRCIGEDKQHEHWLRYARLFLSSHPDALKFGLMHHGVYSHDDINMIGNMDGDFSAWLSGLHSDGLLDNTILVVMADHGHRFAQLRSTHQGQLEERLPFFSITLPEAFKATQRGKKIEKNLRDSNRLLTPFDVHRTLLDVVEMEEGDLASVSHVSQYGDDPHCVIDRNYFLAKYCVCRDRI